MIQAGQMQLGRGVAGLGGLLQGLDCGGVLGVQLDHRLLVEHLSAGQILGRRLARNNGQGCDRLSGFPRCRQAGNIQARSRQLSGRIGPAGGQQHGNGRSAERLANRATVLARLLFQPFLKTGLAAALQAEARTGRSLDGGSRHGRTGGVDGLAGRGGATLGRRSAQGPRIDEVRFAVEIVMTAVKGRRGPVSGRGRLQGIRDVRTAEALAESDRSSRDLNRRSIDRGRLGGRERWRREGGDLRRRADFLGQRGHGGSAAERHRSGDGYLCGRCEVLIHAGAAHDRVEDGVGGQDLGGRALDREGRGVRLGRSQIRGPGLLLGIDRVVEDCVRERRIGEGCVRKGRGPPIGFRHGGDRSRNFGPAFDIATRLGDQGRRALFRHPHPLGQFAGSAVVALLDAGGTVGETAADIVQRLLRPPLRLGDAFAQPVGDTGDLPAQFFQGQGMPVVGRDQSLFDALGEAAHVGLDLAAQLFETGRNLGLDRLDPTIQVLGDAQNLAPHRLDRLGGAFLRRLDLLADGQDRALDPVHPAFGFGCIEPPHHLGAIGFNRPAQGLGELFEAGGLA
uniref:Uncharacterized protein n=1 Tax=Ehrlichia ruminantium TaxID=779 RepID=Q93FS9_EHRRU|nr:unknown [Ehrlichia ruminantium]